MNDTFSSIWLEAGLPNKRKILICNLYREWGYLRQKDRSSHAVPAQLERWDQFLNQWDTAINNSYQRRQENNCYWRL